MEGKEKKGTQTCACTHAHKAASTAALHSGQLAGTVVECPVQPSLQQWQITIIVFSVEFVMEGKASSNLHRREKVQKF